MWYAIGEVTPPFTLTNEPDQEMWLVEIDQWDELPEEFYDRRAIRSHSGIIEVRSITEVEARFLAQEIVNALNKKEHEFRRALTVGTQQS